MRRRTIVPCACILAGFGLPLALAWRSLAGWPMVCEFLGLVALVLAFVLCVCAYEVTR